MKFIVIFSVISLLLTCVIGLKCFQCAVEKVDDKCYNAVPAPETLKECIQKDKHGNDTHKICVSTTYTDFNGQFKVSRRDCWPVEYFKISTYWKYNKCVDDNTSPLKSTWCTCSTDGCNNETKPVGTNVNSHSGVQKLTTRALIMAAAALTVSIFM